MPANVLAMLGIYDQSLSRGAVNAAFTQTCTTGLERARLTLFLAMMRPPVSEAAASEPLAEFDRLRPESLVAVLRERLGTIDGLTEPGPNIEELATRAATLRELPTSMGTRLAVEANRMVLAVVSDAADAVRHSTDSWFETHPSEAKSVIARLRAAIEEVRPPVPRSEALVRLRRIVRSAQDLSARRTAVPSQSFATVTACLAQRAVGAYEDAIGELAASLTAEALARTLHDLRGFLDETARRSAEYQRRLDAIATLLSDREKQAVERNRITNASVILPLNGPDEQEALTGMMERDRCGDLSHLVATMRDRYEQRLREIARVRCPAVAAEDAGLTKLILAIDPDTAASAFVSMVESRLGNGHSLYEQIEKHGVTAAAHYLFERAEHTCHLSERNSEHFNVPTAEISVVRLPPPVGPRDRLIREELRSAFCHLGPCIFSDGAPEENAVSVVRLEIGWPIGIEYANHALRTRYQESAAQGHLPHLIGILTDSPLGEPCSEYRAVFE